MQAAFVSYAPIVPGLRSATSGRARSVHRPLTGRAVRNHGRVVAGLRNAGPSPPSFMDKNNHDDDGGDGYFGDPGDLNQALGMPMPQMNEQELDYFNNAENEDERLRRLKEIAKKRHNEFLRQKMEVKMKAGERYITNASDDYMSRLSANSTVRETARLVALGLRLPSQAGAKAGDAAPASIASPRSPDEDRAAKRRGLNQGELYMDNLTAPPPAPEAEQKVEEDIREAFAGFERQAEAYASPAPHVVSGARAAPAGGTVGKQISFLEEHLAKLQAEEAADSGSLVSNGPDPTDVRASIKSIGERLGSARDGVSHGGPALGDGPGGMTEEETLAAFEEIRAQAAAARTAPPADPLAVPLPSRKDGAAAGTGTADRVDGTGLSPPPGEGARLALIALRIEQNRFIEDQRRTLDQHEANLRKVFAKYCPDIL
jgi:hypothetical protein